MRNLFLLLIGLSCLLACVQKPTACIELTSEEFEAGETFTPINCSLDADEFYWEFGDGSFSTQAQPAYVYTDTGNYLLALVASANHGAYHSSVNLGLHVKAPNLKFEGSYFDSSAFNLMDMKAGQSIWSLECYLNGQFFCNATCRAETISFDKQYLVYGDFIELISGDGILEENVLSISLRLKKSSGEQTIFVFVGEKSE